MDCIFILGIVCSNIHNISCKKDKIDMYIF